MTTKTKLITKYIIINLLLTLAVMVGSTLIINARFSLLEDNYAIRNLNRLEEIIVSDLDYLSKTNKDYAFWDDTYFFIDTYNSAYHDTNVNTLNFKDTLNLDFVYFVNQNNVLVDFWEDGTAPLVTSDSGKFQLPSGMLSAINLARERSDGIDGIISLPTGLALVAIKPVLPTGRNLPSNGMLIIGQFFDRDMLENTSIGLKLPVELSNVQPMNEKNGHFLEKQKKSIYGYTSLRDIFGNVVGALKVTAERDIYSEARMLISYMGTLMLIVFVTASIFIIIFSDAIFGSILHRVSYLSLKANSAVNNHFETPLNYAEWESGRDELGNLAQSVDKMRAAAFVATHELQRIVDEKTKELERKLSQEEKTTEAMVWLLDREKQQNKELSKKENDLKQLTTKLYKSNTDLSEANQVKNEFVNIATHQLKNPLAALSGFVKMLQQGVYGKPPKQFLEPIEQICGCTEQIIALVEDMLKISRSEQKDYPVTIESVNLVETIMSVKEITEPQMMQKKLKFVYVAPKNSPIVLADKDKVKDVITNLISNAIKYSEKGTITISHEFDKDMVITHVTDQGFGIEKKDQGKLFARFFRTPTTVSKGITGTGLGLYIVKEHVTKMKGNVWVESEIGKGSTFSFSLPKS